MRQSLAAIQLSSFSPIALSLSPSLSPIGNKRIANQWKKILRIKCQCSCWIDIWSPHFWRVAKPDLGRKNAARDMQIAVCQHRLPRESAGYASVNRLLALINSSRCQRFCKAHTGEKRTSIGKTFRRRRTGEWFSIHFWFIADLLPQPKRPLDLFSCASISCQWLRRWRAFRCTESAILVILKQSLLNSF